MLLVLFVIFVPYYCISGAHDNAIDQPIPDEIHKQLKGIRTHEDFLKKVNVIPKNNEPNVGASRGEHVGGDEAPIIKVIVPTAGHGHIVDKPDSREVIEPTDRSIFTTSEHTRRLFTMTHGVWPAPPIPSTTIPPRHMATTAVTTNRRFRIIPRVKTGSGMTKEHIISEYDEIIEEPVQSDDSCHVVRHCYPLPLKKKQGHYYFPECIEIDRCLGGCCDNRQHCHPTSVNITGVKVRTYRFLGRTGRQPSFEMVNEGYLRVERHLSCGCAKCSLQACPIGKHWEDCQCVCDNHMTPSDCTGTDQEWSDNDCDCRCKLSTCGANQFLDPDSCRCRNIDEITKRL